MALGADIAQGGVGRVLRMPPPRPQPSVTGNSSKPTSLATYKALTDGGVPPQEAQAAISNPSLMRALAAKYLGPTVRRKCTAGASGQRRRTSRYGVAYGPNPTSGKCRK